MSRIRANQITNQSADGAPTVQNGLVISGVTTSTTFSGSGASLTNIPSAQLTGALPAISGANLTGITQTTINNNAYNRLITGSGTANTLEGEATLTFTNSGSAGQVNLKRSTSTDQEAIFYYGSSNLEIETREATGIKLKTNKSDRVILTSTGNFGLATNSPVAQTLAGGTAITPVLDLKGTSQNNTSGVLQFTRKDNSTQGSCIYSSGDDAGLTFRNTDGNGFGFYTGTTLRFRIDPSGYIKFGESNSGNVAFSIVTNGSGILMSKGTTGNPSNGQTLGDIGFNAYSDSQTTSSADALIRGQAAGNFSGSSAPTDLLFFTKPASTGPGSGPTERMRINKDGQVTQSQQPSFAAYRNQDGYTLNNGIFTFNATRHNIGSHFNTSNHRFTAPVAGRYMFNFYSIYNTSGSSHQIQYRVNNSPQQGMLIHFSHAGGWDNVSYSQIINLNANDYVTMWSISSVNWHGNSWQCFTGELLS